jgi:MarR family transcriptional repressor of mexAB-oprM operon
MSDDSATAEDRLLNLLNRLRMLGPGQPAFEDEDVPVTPSQLVLLDWVAESPGCGVQEMATGLGLTPPTVSVGVRRLEKAGLLERQPNPQDGRSIRLFLTSQGETLYRRAQDFRRGKVRQLLSGLTPQEQETLMELWGRALSAAE